MALLGYECVVLSIHDARKIVELVEKHYDFRTIAGIKKCEKTGCYASFDRFRDEVKRYDARDTLNQLLQCVGLGRPLSRRCFPTQPQKWGLFT